MLPRRGRSTAALGLSVREHIHRALDAGREALFGHAMGNPVVIDALRRAQHELVQAELAELERLRRSGRRSQ